MRIVILFLLVFIEQLVYAQCDELDLSYNSNGILNVNVGNQSGTNDYVVATFNTDTHIIVVGNALHNSIKQGGVVYFNHDGQYLKKTKIGISQFASYDYTVQAACLQHDGKLLVTGHLGWSFGKGPVFVARVNVDGTMDTSFGNNGIVSHNISDTDFNYMSNIIQRPDGSIIARGRAKPHGGDLKAIQVNVNSTGDETSGTLFNFESFSSFSLYEFINGTVFKIDNSSNESMISYVSGMPFPLGADDKIVIDVSETDTKLTGLNILSNNRLAAYGYSDLNDVRVPIVYIFDESGNLDSSFNGTGYKIFIQTEAFVADVVLYNDTYYLTTTSFYSGASIFKLNLDGTAMHDSWEHPFRAAGPIVKGASIFVQDSTFLISGEVRIDGQSDYGLIKYNPCDYKETIFPDYPLTSIGELKQIDQDGIPVLEGGFSTIGIVSSINFSSNNNALISIMDDENEGIFISGGNKDFEYLPQLGDEILVSGLLQSHFESAAELFWRYYRIESKENVIPTPIDVLELNTYSEGVYVQLDHVNLLSESQWKGDGSTFTVNAYNGTQFFKIKIFEDSYWSDKPAPQGKLIVSGIGGQDDPSIPYLSNFEIYPQFEMDITVSTNSIETEYRPLYIYPNPSSNKLFVDLIDQTISKYVIYDSLGKSYRVAFNGNEFNIASLENGIYILSLYNEKGLVIKSQQFIKN